MTRRLFCKYALGSTIGAAGGIGATLLLITGAAAGAEAAGAHELQAGAEAQPPQADISQPHVGAELHPPHPVSQPLSQQLLPLRLKSLLSRPQLFFSPQPLSQPQGSQAAISQPQDGPAPHPQGSQAEISHPQDGSEPHPQDEISHPQDGSEPHPQEDISHPQDGSEPHPQEEAVSQPQLGAALHPLSQLLCLLLSFANNSCRGRRRGLQEDPQGSQAAISQPQDGAAPQPQGSQADISHPQDGSAPQPQGSQADISQPQVGSAPQPLPQGSQAAISQPQDGSAPQPPQPSPQDDNSQPHDGSAEQPVSQHPLSQPAPFSPSIRSNKPPAKVVVLRQRPSTKDPITMFHFIEPQLPKTMNFLSALRISR